MLLALWLAVSTEESSFTKRVDVAVNACVFMLFALLTGVIHPSLVGIWLAGTGVWTRRSNVDCLRIGIQKGRSFIYELSQLGVLQTTSHHLNVPKPETYHTLPKYLLFSLSTYLDSWP